MRNYLVPNFHLVLIFYCLTTLTNLTHLGVGVRQSCRPSGKKVCSRLFEASLGSSRSIWTLEFCPKFFELNFGLQLLPRIALRPRVPMIPDDSRWFPMIPRVRARYGLWISGLNSLGSIWTLDFSLEFSRDRGNSIILRDPRLGVLAHDCLRHAWGLLYKTLTMRCPFNNKNKNKELNKNLELNSSQQTMN